MRRRTVLIAGGWGMAEALVWFVVPDVFLTWVAVRGGTRPDEVMRRSPSSHRPWQLVGRLSGWLFALVLVAVAGAVIGGLLAYAWGAISPDSGAAVMARLPGIDAEMIDRVSDEVAASGSAALLDGPRQTQPYKLYALAAGEQGAGWLSLALWTVPGRAVRFLISGVAAAVAGHVARRFLPNRVVFGAWALFWVVVYAWLWLG